LQRPPRIARLSSRPMRRFPASVLSPIIEPKAVKLVGRDLRRDKLFHCEAKGVSSFGSLEIPMDRPHSSARRVIDRHFAVSRISSIEKLKIPLNAPATIVAGRFIATVN
jgi:hypothetical protein